MENNILWYTCFLWNGYFYLNLNLWA